MDRRRVPIDAASLLAALTARDEGLVGTYVDLTGGPMLRLLDPAVASAAGTDADAVRRANEAIEARIDADPDRYAKVPLYAREYRLMTEFVDTVEDDAIAHLLDAALAGPAAFRRFEAVLTRWPAERARWERFRTEALTRWAVTWLRAVGVEPAWDDLPPEQPIEAPWIVRLAMLGDPDATDAELTRTVRAATEAEAQATFVRVARELCELAREPFDSRGLRNRALFVRLGVEVRREGTAVTVSVRR